MGYSTQEPYHRVLVSVITMTMLSEKELAHILLPNQSKETYLPLASGGEEMDTYFPQEH